MRSPLALAAVFAIAPLLTAADGLHVTPEQAREIGDKIWTNEAGHRVDLLTHWNQGEDFASLGIGHFIWYPKNKKGPFIESFPELLEFFTKNNVKLPRWLKKANYCPWISREDFYKNISSSRMLQLRQLLADGNNVALQAQFAANRLEAALPKMLEQLPADHQAIIREQFYRLAQDPRGLYALMDYVNFKGEGTSPTERYNGEGWGLLQVLEGMTGKDPGQPALDEFAESAKKALAQRVKNSPPERNEARWLPIWGNRIETYRAEAK